jgi:hypothetical protein
MMRPMMRVEERQNFRILVDIFGDIAWIISCLRGPTSVLVRGQTSNYGVTSGAGAGAWLDVTSGARAGDELSVGAITGTVSGLDAGTTVVSVLDEVSDTGAGFEF